MNAETGKFGIGYGKPPVEHRFQKGRSGNPGGRPKGAKNKRPLLDPALQPTDSLILQEAYRMVTIREGDKTIELPAIQASMRSLAIAAMKGSRLSQKALSAIVRQVEERKAAEHLTAVENAFEYKQKWQAELEHRKRRGIVAPDPIPHPDDIVIDWRTGHVRTEGPLDEGEKASWDARLARRDAAQAEVDYFAGRYRRARTDKARHLWLCEWHFEQRIFDLINDGMPTRYKAKLHNRSFQKGASHEGTTLDQFLKSTKK